MVLITPERKQALRVHYGTDAYIGRAMCDFPVQLISNKSELDQSTLKKVYDELSAHGRKLFNSSVEIVKDVSWKMVANTDTVPVFLLSLKNALQKMKSATGAALEKAVCVVVTAAARFWEYLSSFFQGTKRTLETSRDEVMACSELLSRFGDMAIRAIRWIASGVYKMVEVMIATIRDAVIWMGNITGQFTNYLYNHGIQGATEFILLMYSTLHETALHDTDKGAVSSLGVEIARFLGSLGTFVSTTAARTINFFDVTGGLSRVLKWVASFIKAFFNMVMDVVYGITCQIGESMISVLQYMASSMDDIKEHTDRVFEFKELIDLGKESSLNQNLYPENRQRIAFATREFESFTQKKSRPVRPWLMATLLRDLYYDVESDEEIMRMAIEDRTGMDASVFIQSLERRYQLLETEIWLGYRRISLEPTEQVRVFLQSQAQLIEGFFCLFGGCKKRKDDKGKEDMTEEELEEQRKKEKEALENSRVERAQNLQSERDQIARVRGGPENVYSYVETKDPKMMEVKLAELLAELNVAEMIVEREEEKSRPLIEMVEEESQETELNMVRVAQAKLRPGQTVMTRQILDKTKSFGKQLINVANEKLSAAEENREQIQYEINVLKNAMKNLAGAVNVTQRKYSWRILKIALFGGMIYAVYVFTHAYLAGNMEMWNLLRQKSVELGAGGLFDLWKHMYETQATWVSWTKDHLIAPNAETINKVAIETIGALRKTRWTVDTFQASIDQYLNAAIAMSQGKESDITELAKGTVDVIQTALDSGDVKDIHMAQDVLIKFLSGAHEYMMKGTVPSNISAAVSAIRDAAAKTGVFVASAIFARWRTPGFTETGPTGLLMAAGSGASELQMNILENHFKSIVSVVGGFTVMTFYLLFRAAYIGAYIVETNAELGAVVSNQIPRLTAEIIALSAPMFTALRNSAMSVESLQAVGLSTILMAGLYFFPGYALFSGAKTLVSNIRKIEKPGGAQQFLDNDEEVVPKKSRTLEPPKRNRMLAPPAVIPTREPSSVAVYQAFEEHAQAKKIEIEEETTKTPLAIVPSGRRRTPKPKSEPFLDDSTVECSICREPSTLICAHCEEHTYCDKECAAIDWSKKGNHMQVHY